MSGTILVNHHVMILIESHETQLGDFSNPFLLSSSSGRLSINFAFPHSVALILFCSFFTFLNRHLVYFSFTLFSSTFPLLYLLNSFSFSFHPFLYPLIAFFNFLSYSLHPLSLSPIRIFSLLSPLIVILFFFISTSAP